MTIVDEPRVVTPRCRITGCTGAAADHGRGLCLFHLHQPGAAPTAAPTPRHDDEHQGDTVTTITELRDHQAAPDHAPEPSSNGTAKKTRVQRTDEQKRSIVAEYDAAPTGTGKTVLARHGVHPGMVANWKKALGIPPNPRGGARAGTGPAREAPPEAEEPQPTDEPELEADPDVIAEAGRDPKVSKLVKLRNEHRA